MSAAPSPEVRWMMLQAGRLEWALRAYRRFIAELSEDVRSHLTQGAAAQEPYVVVFGQTQVGKTTLLLELMGLGVEAQARVSKVLRGGREFGKSATATTMEYRRSPDRSWYLDEGGGARRAGSDDDMCAALADLRQRMSEQRLRVDKPVVVSIPSDCFARDIDGIGIRMLDLPGDNPADEIERQHVQEMAARYVPYADLILLVGRGDNLSFLDPKVLSLPGIEDWQFVPNRFRIITTYSFTPHSVQQFVRNHAGELNAAHCRERLLEQIQTIVPSLSPDAARMERYFPLEFGQSWQTMLRDDGAFVQRLAPVVATLRDQLHTDIRASANEAARFRNALDVHVVARHKRAACVKRAEHLLAEMAARIAQTEVRDRHAADGVQQADKQYDAVQALLAKRDVVQAEVAAMLNFDATKYITEAADLETTNTSALFVLINDFTAWLRQCFLAAEPASRTAKQFFGNSRLKITSHVDKISKIVQDEFAVLSARMHGYWTNEYWPSVRGTFEKDKAELAEAMRSATAKAIQAALTLWSKHVAKRAVELDAELAAADSERVSMQQIMVAQRTERKHLAARGKRVQAEMEQDLARLDRDAAAAARFSTMLDEEYLAELQQRRTHVAQADSSADALLMLLSMNALQDERKKIKLT